MSVPGERSYNGRRVLVTGASGFIGSHLCDRLSTIGAEVTAVSRQPQESTGGDWRWLQADLTDLDQAKSALAAGEPEIVFHLASEVHGSRAKRHVLEMLKSNLMTAVNVLISATDEEIGRIVLAGSMEEPDLADTPPVPTSPYAAAKWAASGYARMFHALYGTPIVNARIFMVYGPGQRDSTKLVPYVITKLLHGETPQIGSGTRPIDWIFVDDVVDGLVRCGTVADLEGQQIELGTGISYTVRTIVSSLVNIVAPGTEAFFDPSRDRSMETIRVADIETTAQVLGWRPTTHLQDGLTRTVEWYRSQEQKG